MTMIEERWLPIPDAPAYSISDRGEVRDSKGRTVAISGGRASLFRMGMRIRINIARTVREMFPDIAYAALNEPGEIWKAIPNRPGFELSNHARVRRNGCTISVGNTQRTIAPKILKTSRNNGYLVAYLSVGAKKGQIFYVEKCLFDLFPELIPDPMIASLHHEEWRDIAGFEGFYKISNMGRVLSLTRIIDDGQGRNRYIRARIREPGSDSGGYPKVDLARDGSTQAFLVHRLVAEAFIPNALNLPIVHHKDEDRTNARADNLEWATAGGNVRDWFEARPHRIDLDLIEKISFAINAGKTPAEILAALPRKRKAGKS